METYLDNIARVTREDVLRVAREHLHPDKAVILVVGSAEKFEKPLSTFGQVSTIELEKTAE
jgi:zinc protease